MDHLQPYTQRKILRLPSIGANGWQLKRYAILAENKQYDPATVLSASTSAIKQLPKAGKLEDPSGNHGVGFQIIHFAQVAVVSPIFYWVWGSVLANTHQMRAQYKSTNEFETGVEEVVGCVWEMQIVNFETQSWMKTVLGDSGALSEKLAMYLESSLPDAAEEFRS